MSHKSTPISELRNPKVGDADATVREVLDEIEDEASRMCADGMCVRPPSASSPPPPPPPQPPPPPPSSRPPPPSMPSMMSRGPSMMGGGGPELMGGGGLGLMGGGGAELMGGGGLGLMGGVPMMMGGVPMMGGLPTRATSSGGAPDSTGGGGGEEVGWRAWTTRRLSEQQDLFVMALVIYAMQFVDVRALLKLDNVKMLSRVPTIGAISTTVASLVAYVGLKRALR